MTDKCDVLLGADMQADDDRMIGKPAKPGTWAKLARLNDRLGTRHIDYSGEAPRPASSNVVRLDPWPVPGPHATATVEDDKLTAGLRLVNAMVREYARRILDGHPFLNAGDLVAAGFEEWAVETYWKPVVLLGDQWVAWLRLVEDMKREANEQIRTQQAQREAGQ